MKTRLQFFLLCLAVAPSSQALAQSGSVQYVHTLSMDIELPPEMEQFAEYLPESVTTAYNMDFTESTSLTTQVDSEIEMAGGTKFSRGDVNIKMSFQGSGTDDAMSETYVNLDEWSYVEQRDFLGRTFLIEGELPDIAWKFSGEEGQMLGHHVLQATAMWDTSAVEAWFTPEIPVSLGPAQFGGLPGLILMLSIDEGSELYEAKEINLEAEPAIARPEKGRQVTKEEFETIMAEKMEEMQQNTGRISTFVIRGQ